MYGATILHGMGFRLLCGCLTLACVVCGCASETAAVDEVDEAEAAASSRPANDVIVRQVAAMEIPASHVGKREAEIFASDDEVRKFFGESCGPFCAKPWEGRLPFAIQDPPGRQSVAVYVNKPEVPSGRELVITGIERRGNPKWLYVTTCTRAATRGRAYAFAIAEVNTTLPIIWVSAPEQGAGLELCR